MNAVKRKDKFLDGIITQQSKVQDCAYTEEMVYEDINELQKLTEDYSKLLWAYCREHRYTELP